LVYPGAEKIVLTITMCQLGKMRGHARGLCAGTLSGCAKSFLWHFLAAALMLFVLRLDADAMALLTRLLAK